MSNILGLNLGQDGAVALLVNGRLACAVAHERLSRKKKSAGVTREMIAYVLDATGLRLDAIDMVAFAGFHHHPDNCVTVLERDGAAITDNRAWRERRSALVGERMSIPLRVEIDERRIDGLFVNHHMAHAASTFYTSPFERAACFTVDASHTRPEGCSLFAYGEGHRLHYHSCPGVMIGNAYADFTERLGVGSGSTRADTTMALASFGEPSALARERWRHYGQSFYARSSQYQASDEVFTNLMWADLSGLPPHARLTRGESDSRAAMGIAASLEYVFEQTLLENARTLHALTRTYNGDNLCLAGGSFLNSNANMLITSQSPFARVHLFPGCGDDGTAVGSAMYAAHHVLGLPRVAYAPREYMYTGRTYEVDEPGGEPFDAHTVARALSEGRIVAFFHGGSEFGPRALGHRSLLADPRNPRMKDILNRRVKHREWFRPFAPIVLSEKAADWFDIDVESKLMLFIAPIRYPDRLPAIAHVDGSARLQTMAREDNPRVYAIIEAFERITGVPIILNTGLNDNGEPLVETPRDALNFFQHQDVDMLVLEDRIFRRAGASVAARDAEALEVQAVAVGQP